MNGDFSFYFGLGWHHIIGWDALDHILFVIVLAAVYMVEDWKRLLILVTAFTVGHSISLALSVYDVVRFPSKWVEFLIPCTIVITALSNLSKRDFGSRSIRLKYYLALFFGLIHGMGFANMIRFMLAKDQQVGISLLAFNLGLEAGQIAVLLVLFVAAFLMVRRLGVQRRDWIVFLSAAAFALALQMALERVPSL